MYYGNSTAIGNIGEAVAIAEFTKRGYNVYSPLGQNTPCDIIIEKYGKYFRIQCKTTANLKQNGSVMEFQVCRSNGFTFEKKPYTSTEIDYIFLYCIENNYCGLIHISEIENRISCELRIRTIYPLNNQIDKVRMMDKYSLDNQLPIYPFIEI